MNLAELRQYKPQILALAKQYGVNDIRVFGSVAKGLTHKGSDVDLLIDRFDGSFLRFAALKGDLEELLGTKVDIFKPENIRHPLIKKSIDESATPL